MILLILVTLLEPVEGPLNGYQINYEYSQKTYPDNPVVEEVSMFDPAGKRLWIHEINAPAASFPLAEGGAILLIERAPQARKMEVKFLNPEGMTLASHEIENFRGPVEIRDNYQHGGTGIGFLG